jgi:hypothetical protein
MSAPLIASSTGKYITTCKLCRRRVAESVALNIPIVGEPGKRATELTKILMKHLEKHHAEEFQRGASMLAEFPAFLILAAFEYEDASMRPRLEQIRAAIFQVVRKNTMQDAMLVDIVAGFGFDEADAAKVYEAMRAVRDACCELGQFAPEMPPAPKPPVTA